MGPYDNEQGEYLASPELDDGDWYLDGDDQLYIVPSEGEIEGPDTPVLAQLNEAYRQQPKPSSEQVAQALGLTAVSPALRRFSAEIGYYTA